MNNPPRDVSAVARLAAGTSVSKASTILAAAFRANGLQSPGLDARLLVCHGCGLTHEQFIADPSRVLDQPQARTVNAFACRRIAREPVSRIVGHREFHGLDFVLGPETLDPRPDTETLVEAALEVAARDLAGASINILDLGTGSGCVLVSLLQALPKARGTGIDIRSAALDHARENAKAHAVAARSRFICADFMSEAWAHGLEERFNLVVSNPPYIPTGDIAGLEPEVSGFDPIEALDGGADGLAAYRQIIAGLGEVLDSGGWAIFEIGAGQEDAVSELLRIGGWVFASPGICYWRDLAGHVRCVGAKCSPRCK